MSALASLLAGRTPPGLYVWRAGYDAGEVRHTVEQAGWGFGHVAGLDARTKGEVLRALGETFAFPDWYGQNFDALADCLTDVGSTGVGTVLLWDDWGPFARGEARAFSVALSVLGGRVAADRGGPFAVLLRGEGPEVAGVPVLD